VEATHKGKRQRDPERRQRAHEYLATTGAATAEFEVLKIVRNIVEPRSEIEEVDIGIENKRRSL
jgi:hypothetical protein